MANARRLIGRCPHLINVGQYPQEILDKMHTSHTEPTFIFNKVFGNIDSLGDCMPFVGRTRVFSNMKDAKALSIDSRILGFFETFYSHYVRDRVLIFDYKMASPYVLGEYTSLAKYARYPPLYLEKTMQLAFSMCATAFTCMSNSRVVLPREAASLMDRTTSPGYPWSLMYATKGDCLDSCSYWGYYTTYREMVRKGIPVSNFWKGFVKREPKKTAKLLLHLPRTVLSAAMQHLHMGYELFVDQNEKIKTEGAAGRIPAFVGATKFFGGWNKLHKRLSRFPNAFDGDFDQWDSSMFEALFNGIRDLRYMSFHTRNYSKEEDLALWNMIKNYYLNVVRSVVVGSEGDVFMKLMGMPSGQYNTLTDNCLAQCVLWFYHWVLVVVPNVEGTRATWTSFKEHVELVVQGDDVLWSCSDAVVRFMTPKLADRTFKSLGFGLKYTSNFSRPVEELEFCSTNFEKHYGIWMPVLRFEKLMASMCYGHNLATCNARNVLMRLMSLRVEGFFNVKFRVIVEELITWFKEQYTMDLNSHFTRTQSDPLSYQQILDLYKSDYEIVMLYVGMQG